MSVLDKILLEHKEKVLQSAEYTDLCEKIKSLSPEVRQNIRLSKCYRDGSADVDFFGPVGVYSRDDLRKLGISIHFYVKNVIWVEEDYDIDGYFRGFCVQMGENREYFTKQEDLFDFIGRFHGYKVLSYSSDCGEEAVNVVDNPSSWFNRD